MSKNLCTFTFLIVLLVGAYNTGSAQNQDDFSRFTTWLKEDPVSMFQNVDAEHLIGYGSVGLSIVYLSAFDESSSRRFQQNYGDSRVLNFTNTFGSKMVLVPASAALFGTSLLTNNTRFQDAAFTSLQSVFMTSLAVGAGKFMFARERPSPNEGTYDFDFMSAGETSFPSGHTARAFAFITPWIMYYPNAFTYTLFLIPAGTAIARVAEGKHWLSDVAAGAVIGFSMGHYLAKKHLGDHRIQITPAVGKDMAAFSINFQF